MTLVSLRSLLETRQVAIYFAAVVLAGLVAWQWPASTAMTPAIDPLLAFMLFVTFLQVPLTELRRALSNMRFLGALLLANFVAVPVLVAVLLPWMPQDPLLRIGVLLVLLTPCIDYVVTFAHLGKADAKPLLASTPLLLAAQMVLLPVYLNLFMGDAAAGLVQLGPFLHAFIWLIAVPLSLAAICQAWAARSTAGERAVAWLGLLPVPATAAVLFVVVASVAPQLGLALDAVRQVAAIYVAFAVAAPLLGWGVARLCRLPADQGRAVAFSSATRNSLVVLPLGLAIPGAVPWVPAVIVTQTLVELVSELVYVKVAPSLGAKAVRQAS
ncbi:arsenic resistance protein [Pseudorhodoferax soli]|uniref:ACR3 family arsenite efflux pump ArsB n=1 Tax=Pseudorhodoferax soli TaxID=545864 RepID=A0A368XFU6_9BURK|nr:arsenic resistance protein [Pseudorhodoferax soli]RCW66076.1 ACR3 family arsenite efflux pump ArsB [Pseudorhodoferax soli]